MIKVLILLALLLVGCASTTSKLKTVPVKDHKGKMHEYIRFELESDIFCLIHQEYEKVFKKEKDEKITVALH